MTNGLIRNIIAGTVIAGILYFTGGAISNRLDEYLLNPNDFDKAKWTEVYNLDGVIWDDYMKAKIPHNQDNWQLYIKQVREKNHRNLEGRIQIPNFE